MQGEMGKDVWIWAVWSVLGEWMLDTCIKESSCSVQSLSHTYVVRCIVCCSNAPSLVMPEWQKPTGQTTEAAWRDDV